MGIMPNFNKVGSHRTSLGCNGDLQKAALLTYFSLVSYPCLFNFYYCIESFHGWEFHCVLQQAIRVPQQERSDQPANKPAPPHPEPSGALHWTAAPVYFWFKRKSLTWWITSSTSCDILGKNTAYLQRTLKPFTYSHLWSTQDGKIWVLLCAKLSHQYFPLLEVSYHQDYVYPKVSLK